MRRALQAVAALGAVGLGACLGPYPNIGEKLDVTSKVSGRSYLTVDAGNARVLVLAPLDGGSSAPFTRIDEFQPRAVETLQGSWSPGAELSFSTSTIFTLPDELTKPISSRRGATRKTLSPPSVSTATIGTVTSDTLELSGPPEVAGTYHTLVTRTAHISGTDETSPACAFHVANLAVESSEARVPGFNSPGLTQYLNRVEPFQGILSGTMTIGLVGLFSPVSTITFTNYADYEGVVLNGQQNLEHRHQRQRSAVRCARVSHRAAGNGAARGLGGLPRGDAARRKRVRGLPGHPRRRDGDPGPDRAPDPVARGVRALGPDHRAARVVLRRCSAC